MYLFWAKSSDRTPWFLTKATLSTSPIASPQRASIAPCHQQDLPQFDRAIVALQATPDRLADLKHPAAESFAVVAIVAKGQAIAIGVYKD